MNRRFYLLLLPLLLVACGGGKKQGESKPEPKVENTLADTTALEVEQYTELPAELQNRIWVSVVDIDGEYHRSAYAYTDSIITHTDRMGVDLMDRIEFQIVSASQTKNGWDIKTKNGKLFTFRWIDKARQLGTWQLQQAKGSPFEYRFTMMEAEHEKKLPAMSPVFTYGVKYCEEHYSGEELLKKLTIHELDEFLDSKEEYRVEKSIEMHLNKDRISDVITLMKYDNEEDAQDLNIYMLYIFEGQKDGSYLLRLDNKYDMGKIKIEDIEAEGDQIRIHYFDSSNQNSYTYSYMYDKKMNDWILKIATQAKGSSIEERKLSDKDRTLRKEAVTKPSKDF